MMPTAASLEHSGISHVLSAEANGDLHTRHPYIYASADDLRVADVELLLAAYKQLVCPAPQGTLRLQIVLSTNNESVPHSKQRRLPKDKPTCVRLLT